MGVSTHHEQEVMEFKKTTTQLVCAREKYCYLFVLEWTRAERNLELIVGIRAAQSWERNLDVTI